MELLTMKKQNKSKTTPSKEVKKPLISRMVFLGKHNYEEFTFMLQILGNIFQYVIFDHLTNDIYQGYFEDETHESNFNYVSLGDVELKKAAAGLFERAMGHCNALRSYKQYLLDFEKEEKEAKGKKRKAKHVKLDIDKDMVIKLAPPQDGETN